LGAEVIYSHDKNLKKIAEKVIEVREIPQIISQEKLF
jgi:hypothetical protein